MKSKQRERQRQTLTTKNRACLQMQPRPVTAGSTNQLADMQMTSQHRIVPAQVVTSPAHLCLALLQGLRQKQQRT